jgi:hypothetical protein
MSNELKGAPTEPGWYWLKTDKVKWHMVLIQDEEDLGLWVFPLGTGGEDYRLDELTNAQWSGPLKAPSP